MAKSTRQHWNTYWQREEHQVPLTYNRKLIGVLCSFAEVQNKVVLEIGAGTGRDSVYLAGLGATVYALDYSCQALRLVKTLYIDQGAMPLPIAADAFELPFSSNSVDLIFHQGFLEHFKRPELLLQEQWRVLRRGGYVMVDVPQKYTLYSLRKHIAMRRGQWFAGWETEYSPHELEELVSTCGFELLSTYGWGMALSYGWAMQKLITGLRNLARSWKSTAPQPTSLVMPNKDPNGGVRKLAGRAYLHLTDNIGVVGRKP
jgi:ubiquinone/menaquinone biosynthesis C-methylase UbiE